MGTFGAAVPEPEDARRGRYDRGVDRVDLREVLRDTVALRPDIRRYCLERWKWIVAVVAVLLVVAVIELMAAMLIAAAVGLFLAFLIRFAHCYMKARNAVPSEPAPGGTGSA
jgi:hypothetical protein